MYFTFEERQQKLSFETGSSPGHGNIIFLVLNNCCLRRSIFAQGAGKRLRELPDSDRSFPTPGKTQVTNVLKCMICLILTYI